MATAATSATAADASPTKLVYYDDMFKFQSSSTLLSYSQVEDGRSALILDSTIFHPEGGGQPTDTGVIAIRADPDFKFIVNDVRSKDGIVFHYGFVEKSDEGSEPKLTKGIEVALYIDELRRKLNSRLHSAGHVLDACMKNVGWGHLEPSKAYQYPEGPYVEYRGKVPQNEIQSKQEELDLEANKLISEGCEISVAILPYEEASRLCGGRLPDYFSKESTPRVVKLGNNFASPCGGTHVADISEVVSVKVGQIRSKKGATRVYFSIGS